MGAWDTLDQKTQKQLAEALLIAGSLYQALDSYEKLYSAYCNQHYLLEQASIQEKLNEEAAALKLYIKLNEIAPDANFLKNSRLKVFYRLRNYEEPIKGSKELFAQDDSGLVIQKVAGIANYHQEEYQKSIKLLTKVGEVESESDYLHYYLGLAFRDSGDKEKAAEDLEKAIELGVTKNLGNYYTQLAVNYEEAGETAKARGL